MTAGAARSGADWPVAGSVGGDEGAQRQPGRRDLPHQAQLQPACRTRPRARALTVLEQRLAISSERACRQTHHPLPLRTILDRPGGLRRDARFARAEAGVSARIRDAAPGRPRQASRPRPVMCLLWLGERASRLPRRVLARIVRYEGRRRGGGGRSMPGSRPRCSGFRSRSCSSTGGIVSGLWAPRSATGAPLCTSALCGRSRSSSRCSGCSATTPSSSSRAGTRRSMSWCSRSAMGSCRRCWLRA